MAKLSISILASIVLLLTVLVTNGCQPKMDGEPVNLEPNDTRQILSVDVTETNEATLLIQQLELDVVRIEGSTIYFFEPLNQLGRLAELGYELERQNSYDVFRRVVRIDNALPESELIANGVRVINREEKYLVVDATIGQLRALVRAGSQIVTVTGDEPRPRQVRIIVESMTDVAAIGAMAVDIYSTDQSRRKPTDSQEDNRKAEIAIYAAAFDYQIDQLEDSGYSVELLP